MLFLIDGYNLMHAVGYASKAMAAGELARGRDRFLNWLADLRGDRADGVRVVFDAVEGRKSAESMHRGLFVRYAYRQTADDVIEHLIATEKQPKQLAVVSNDHRIQEAARRKRCQVLTCEAFVDWLMAPALSPTPKPPEPDKPATATDDEMAAWLDVFSQPMKKPRKKR